MLIRHDRRFYIQDRYVGDVDDFGKLGVLRCLGDAGFYVVIKTEQRTKENEM